MWRFGSARLEPRLCVFPCFGTLVARVAVQNHLPHGSRRQPRLLTGAAPDGEHPLPQLNRV